MAKKQKITKGIFSRFWLLVLACIMVMGPLGPFHNTLEAANIGGPGPRYKLDLCYMDFLFKPSGLIETHLEINMEALRDLKRLQISIPYGQDQSLDLKSFSRAECNPEGQLINIQGERSTTPLDDTSSLEAYYVQDTGTHMVLDINAAIPQGATRHLIMDYDIYGASTRYPDVAASLINILSKTKSSSIGKLALRFRFEAPVYEEELADFFIQQRNNLGIRSNLVEAVDAGSFLQKMSQARVKTEEKNPSFYYYGENIAANSGFQVQAIYPSVWIPRQSIEGDEDRLDDLMDQQISYHIEMIRIHDIRHYGTILTHVFWGLGLIGIAFNEVSKSIRRRRTSRVVLEPDTKDGPFSALAFLESLSLNSKVLYSAVLELVQLGYLAMDNRRLVRVPERLIQDKQPLYDFQRLVLHGVWDFMEGEDSLDISRFENISEEKMELKYKDLQRVRNLYEVFLLERGWIPLPGQKKPQKLYWIPGLVYIGLGLLLAGLGRYLRPLTLVLLGLVYIFLAFRKVRYTAKGEIMLIQMKAHKRYLKEIDQTLRDMDKAKAKLNDYFIASIAYDCTRSFLLNFRYVLSLDEFMHTGFLRRFGYQKLQQTTERYIKQKSGLRARALMMFYLYIYREEEKVLNSLQNTLVALRYRMRRGLEEERDPLGRPISS